MYWEWSIPGTLPGWRDREVRKLRSQVIASLGPQYDQPAPVDRSGVQLFDINQYFNLTSSSLVIGCPGERDQVRDNCID